MVLVALFFAGFVSKLFVRITTTKFRHKGFCSLADIVQNLLVGHFGMSQGIILTQFADVFCVKAAAYIGCVHSVLPQHIFCPIHFKLVTDQIHNFVKIQ